MTDRYYRGTCPHGTWMALVTDPGLASQHGLTITTPCGCTVVLTTREGST